MQGAHTRQRQACSRAIPDTGPAYAVAHADSWGWRLSLGFAFVPSFCLFMGGLRLPDSPNSLLERGFPEKVPLLPGWRMVCCSASRN